MPLEGACGLAGVIHAADGRWLGCLAAGGGRADFFIDLREARRATLRIPSLPAISSSTTQPRVPTATVCFASLSRTPRDTCAPCRRPRSALLTASRLPWVKAGRRLEGGEDKLLAGPAEGHACDKRNSPTLPYSQAAERTLDLGEAVLGTDGADVADAEHPPPAVQRRAWPDDELVLPHGGLEPFESVPCLSFGVFP